MTNSWFNDFLSVSAFAQYYGIHHMEALHLINSERALDHKRHDERSLANKVGFNQE
jgi:hypothetical protein